MSWQARRGFILNRAALDPVASGGGGSDAAWTTSFLARTSGLDAAHTSVVKTMMNAMAAAGLDAKCDVAWLTALPGANGNLNLKSSSYTLTNHGATHTNDLGYTGDGAAQYVDTTFSPSTNGAASSATSVAWTFFQSATADFSNGPGMAIANGDFANYMQAADFGSDLSGRLLNLAFGAAVSEPAGMTTVSLTSTLDTYHNTANVEHNATLTGKNAAFSTGTLTLLGNSNVGFSAGPIGFAGVFAGLSSSDVTALYNTVHTALHALNATGYP